MGFNDSISTIKIPAAASFVPFDLATPSHTDSPPTHLGANNELSPHLVIKPPVISSFWTTQSSDFQVLPTTLYLADGRVNAAQVAHLYQNQNGNYLIVSLRVAQKINELVELAKQVGGEVMGVGLTRKLGNNIEIVEDLLLPERDKILLTVPSMGEWYRTFLMTRMNTAIQYAQSQGEPILLLWKDGQCVVSYKVQNEQTKEWVSETRSLNYTFRMPLKQLIDWNQFSEKECTFLLNLDDNQLTRLLTTMMKRGYQLSLRTDWEFISDNKNGIPTEAFWQRVERTANDLNFETRFNAHYHPASFGWDNPNLAPFNLQPSHFDISFMYGKNFPWFSIHAINNTHQTFVRHINY